MITAEIDRPYARRLVRTLRRRVQRSFDAVRVRGLERMPRADASAPVLLYANHVGWWDATLLFMLSADIFHHDAVGLMDDTLLALHPQFARIGGIGLAYERPLAAMRTLGMLADACRAQRGFVWMFPQPIPAPPPGAPLRFTTLAARLMRMLGDVIVVPVALHCEFLDAERPEVLVSVAAPWHITRHERIDIPIATRMLELLLEDELDLQREAILSRELDPYTTVYTGR